MEYVVQCKPPLRTHSPDALLKTYTSFQKDKGSVPDGLPGAPTARFELSLCPQIDPGSVMLLMYAARCAAQWGWAPVISARKNPTSAAFGAVREHLTHFNADKEERAKLPKAAGDYPLRGVNSEAELVTELEEWADCVSKVTEITEEELALWTTHISELVTNSFQHGTTNLGRTLGPIMIAGEANKTERTVQLAVLDTGSGIPNVLRPTVANLASKPDCEVIRQACQPRVTSHCDPANQGLGLPALVAAVRKNQGALQIVSGNGLCHLARGRLYTRQLLPQPGRTNFLDGTLAVITVKGAKWKQ